MSKIYVLQKDLPDGAKVGDEYELRGRDRYYNIRLSNNNCPVVEECSYFTWQVEKNESFFKLKEEPKPTVVDEVVCFPDEIHFHINDKWYIAPRRRLAEIFIAESKGELKDLEYYKAEFDANVDKRYTEKELLEAEEKAFNAGRELQNFWFKSFDPKQLQYPTFSDYKNQNK